MTGRSAGVASTGRSWSGRRRGARLGKLWSDAGALRAPAVGGLGGGRGGRGDRDRSGAGLRHGRACHDASVSGADARAGEPGARSADRCWMSVPDRGCLPLRGLGLALPPCWRSTMSFRASRRRKSMRLSTGAALRSSASTCATSRSRNGRDGRARQSAAPAAARALAHDCRAPFELVASGLLREQADEVAEAFRARFGNARATQASARRVGGPVAVARLNHSGDGRASCAFTRRLPVGDLCRGAHDRPVDEVDRCPHAIL